MSEYTVEVGIIIHGTLQHGLIKKNGCQKIKTLTTTLNSLRKSIAYSFSHITRHKVIHGRHNLRSQRELVLNMEVGRKFLDNIGLSTVEQIVAGENL